MTQPSEREIEVFNAALELSSAERVAYLDQVCADDAALRHRVEELLKANGKAGGFLQSAATGSPGPGGTFRVSVVPTEKAGDRIGRYKLLQQIGEGGCGVVYMAEQEEPVRRKVALKVIKLGMDTKEVIARFEAERQALALMDHPNIAKVLDAGATSTGRPYFVMELVRGIKITDYCDENNLSTVARLELFIQVCQAIQHAHQKGIIHRDIKPSNILVADHDGVPVPKIIDFGIAKATTDQRLTDKTFFTAFEQFIGTPAYMSPEQAKLSGLDIDTRSDIYSLGVLLYELLTGQTPFDAKELLQAGLDEIRRVIREQEPARPSTCLSTMVGADLTAIAKRRKAEPPKLIHLVQGDLDWIVMKALEKDRTRRYETANGLAGDILRHLANEPVTACPPSNFYRLQKMVRRNKLVVAAVTAVIGSLILGLGASTWFLLRERQARQETATAQANEADLREKLRECVRQYAEAQAKVREQQPGEDATTLQQRTYNELAKQFGVDSKVLQDKLPQFAKELKTAPGTAPYDRANAAYLANDYTEAIKGFREAAEGGNSQAQANLGYMYYHGLGAITNYPEAIRWCRKAAESGNIQAQCDLGYMYAHPLGVPPDYLEAIKWFRQAAEAGSSRGQDAVGWMYEHGEGVKQDYTEAVKWYRKGAESGDPQGQTALAYQYEHGRGVGMDYTEAMKWYRKAAEQGENGGRNAMGWMYEQGLGVRANYTEAMKWYRMAADSGDNAGRNNVGRMYEQGHGVEKNIAAAAKWYRKAAEAGDTWGRDYLAQLYAHGVGLTLKFVKVDSEDTTSQYDGRGENAVDGDPDTFWHTQWQSNSPGLPHQIIIELVPPSTIKGFTYLPRQDGWDHGNIKDYEFYVSNDGKDFGQPVKIGAFQSGKEKKTAIFAPIKCRFIKLRAISEIEGRPYASAAEIGVIQNREKTSGKDGRGENTASNEVCEVVTLMQVPLTDAIRQLALQAGLNITFDPTLLNQKAADGTPIPPPNVMEKWRKVTALQALQALLDNYGWQMTQEPGASIFRIGAQDPSAAVPPIREVNLLENAPTNGAAGNEIIPALALDHVSLLDAIRALALQAELNIQFDPRLSNRQDTKVTEKWKNLTGRQALQALLDSYGLQMTQIPGNPIFRIVAKNP